MSASDQKRTWKTLGRRLLDRRLVVASGRSERDIEPVPPVDSNDAQRKLRELLFAKFFASLVVNLIRNFLVCETGDCFSPGKRRALASAIQIRDLTPGREHINALLRLAARPQILRMHIEAEGASVNLRHTLVDEVDKPRSQARLLNHRLQREHPLKD